jgi:peroxiredoxin
MTRNQITFLASFVVLAALAGFFTMRPTAQNRREEPGKDRAAVGLLPTSRQPLPDYRLVKLDRQEVSVDELRRGRVLLVFLTTNCDACLKEVEVISHLQHDVPPGFRVYGIGIERPAQINAFVKEFDLQFPMLIDVGSQLAKSLDVHYFPSKYLVEDGVITKVWRGKTQDEADLRHQLGIE